jgi:transcription elongation factor
MVEEEPEVVNPDDLMFATEVDVQKLPPRSSTSMQAPLEEMLDQNYMERPNMMAQFASQEDAEFKGLLKKLVKRTQKDVLELED